MAAYSTSFPAAENPIREGAKWLNGLADGVAFGDVQTSVGSAYAAALITGLLTDALAIINPSYLVFNRNHWVQATVFVNPAYTPPSSHECELLLRGTVNPSGPNYFPLIELNFPWNGTNGQIIRQDGTLGGFTDITDITSLGWDNPLVTGDIVYGEIRGSSVKVYVTNSANPTGKLAMTATDAITGGGNPGMGFFVRSGTGADPTQYCFTNISMGDFPDFEPGARISNVRKQPMLRGPF